MKLSNLIAEQKLEAFWTHICPDWLAHYVGKWDLWSTVITTHDKIIKVLDDNANVWSMLWLSKGA